MQVEGAPDGEGCAISIRQVGKSYRIWSKPQARLTAALGSWLASRTRLPISLRRYFQVAVDRVCHQFHALESVSFEVRKGEAVGIIGRNGSGKSTLLQIVAGTMQPSSGQVAVCGRVAALLELGSGFNPDFTGEENVLLNGVLLGLSRAEITRRFPEIVSFADIGEFIDQPVKTYSSGMMMRLAFAVQTAVDPEILIVDEALSVGDETFQRKCFARLENLRAKGTTVLLVSHDMGSILNFCSRAIFLHRGRIILQGDPKFVVNRYQKYSYAPDYLAGQILTEIQNEAGQTWGRRESSDCGEALTDGDVVGGEPALHQDRPVSGGSSIELPLPPADWPEMPFSEGLTMEEGFDPVFATRSLVRYDALGAEIGSVGIYNAKQERVNCLVRGREYQFVYRVCFTQPARQVAFAFLIKTPKGQELGGAVTRPLLAEVAAGSEYEVSFKFHCLLTPWIYFLNAGVEGLVGDRRTYLHRLIDAAVFKVATEKDLQVTALVDFHTQPACRLVAGPSS